MEGLCIEISNYLIPAMTQFLSKKEPWESDHTILKMTNTESQMPEDIEVNVSSYPKKPLLGGRVCGDKEKTALRNLPDKYSYILKCQAKWITVERNFKCTPNFAWTIWGPGLV